ncbi:MAG: hypothetical protein V4631_04715 [Pseudomonadota bacterium]
MIMRMGALAMLAMLAMLAGCATVSESGQQGLMVRTIQDNREIGGVGCVLTNDAGRWFVVSPGHVTVTKSAGNLFVDCKKGVVSAGQERFASRANSTATIGNAVATLGLGYLLDKRTGAGFDYPETLTVLMRGTGRQQRDDPDRQESSSSVVY